MADGYFLCIRCGQVNRISNRAHLSPLKCTKCGEPATVQEFKRNSPLDLNLISIKQFFIAKLNIFLSNPKMKYFSLGVISVVVIIALAKPSIHGDDLWPPPAVRPAQPQIFQAPGVMWNVTNRPAVAPLAINTNPGSDYYVKLVDATYGTPAMAIFVKGGQPLEVEVPLGSYYIHYASGKNWQGEAVRFGLGNLTSYHEAGKRFDFIHRNDHISGYTIELIRQTGGNLSTKSISAAQF